MLAPRREPAAIGGRSRAPPGLSRMGVRSRRRCLSPPPVALRGPTRPARRRVLGASARASEAIKKESHPGVLHPFSSVLNIPAKRRFESSGWGLRKSQGMALPRQAPWSGCRRAGATIRETRVRPADRAPSLAGPFPRRPARSRRLARAKRASYLRCLASLSASRLA